MKNIAIVGFGFMGSMHAQVYQNIPGVRLAAIVDSRVEPARLKAKKLGLLVPVHASLSEVEKADIVDVCLPTDLHASTTLEAIKKGRDVFCEKPIARTLAEAEEITNAVRKQGVRFMVGQCIRFWPEYEAFVKFVRSKQAGRLLSLSMQRRASRPLDSTDNWNQDESRSLGSVVELHIHDTDFAHHLSGNPKSVLSVGTQDSAGWSHIFTDYAFPGVIVQAEGGWNYPAKWGFQMAFQAIFENGTVEFDSRKQPTLTCTLDTRETAPLPFDAPPVGASKSGQGNITSLGGYQRELEYFIDCIQNGRQPEIATGEQATQSLRTCLAEVCSCIEKKRIPL